MDRDLLIRQHKKRNLDEVQIAEQVLKLNLWDSQKKILRDFFQLNSEGKPKYEEWMLVCGKKSSKTFTTAVINLILVYKLILMDDFFKRFSLVPQDVFLLNTCAGKEQSIKVYLNQVKGIITLSPFMQEFKEGETNDEIRFNIPGYKTMFILKAQSSRSTSSLGYLCFSVTFDELAWFQDSSNRSCSKEVYAALYPNIKPFGGYGYSFILSSPSDTGAWFYSHFEFAMNSAKRLVIQKSTWEMNPNIKEEDLEEEKKRDYDKWIMDWQGNFIESVGGAFTPEIIEAAIKLDIRDISVRDKRQRVIALDPGLKRDAYALAMGYIENYKLYIDYVHYWIGTRNVPVKISDVEEHVRYLFKNYIISKIVLDQRYSASTIQRLGAEGFPIFETFVDSGYKQKMYQNFKEKLNMHEVFLPHDEKTKSELIALKRKGSGATTRYEAPTVGVVKHDDMADAVANCCYQLCMLNEEGTGTDDFAIDGESILLDEESIKEKLKAMTPAERERHDVEDKRRKEQEQEAVDRVEKSGGFCVG